jgi:hypothetical protein
MHLEIANAKLAESQLKRYRLCVGQVSAATNSVTATAVALSSRRVIAGPTSSRE